MHLTINIFQQSSVVYIGLIILLDRKTKKEMPLLKGFMYLLWHFSDGVVYVVKYQVSSQVDKHFCRLYTLLHRRPYVASICAFNIVI